MRYELGDNERPVVSKETIVELVESTKGGLATKPAVLLAAARKLRVPDERNGDTAWARTVIDYPASERVFDKMVSDRMLSGMQAHEWRGFGVETYLQNRTTYYATARRELEIMSVHRKVADMQLWQRIEQSAMRVLASRHGHEFAELMQEMYDELS